MNTIVHIEFLYKVEWKKYVSKNNGKIMGLIFISVRHYSLNTLVESRKDKSCCRKYRDKQKLFLQQYMNLSHNTIYLIPLFRFRCIYIKKQKKETQKPNPP